MASCICKSYKYHKGHSKCQTPKYNDSAAATVIGLLLGINGIGNIYAVNCGSCAHTLQGQPNNVAFWWFKGQCLVQTLSANIATAIQATNWANAPTNGVKAYTKRTGIYRVAVNIPQNA